MGSIREELCTLLHPYYIVNLVLSASFLFLRTVRPFCQVLFPIGGCELDWRETEILFFLLVIVMFRSRKTGSVTLVRYMSSAFVYVKCANLILFFYADPRMGLVFLSLWILQALTLPEPSYQGPDQVIYFSGPNLEEEISGDTKITWLVAFYAAWSPPCVQFAPLFAKLSAEYGLDNLKFGKLDVTRYPEVAKKHYVNDASYSRQLPTVILYRNGKEAIRRPMVDSKGHVLKFIFTEEAMKSAFDLNNLYSECKISQKAKKLPKLE